MTILELYSAILESVGVTDTDGEGMLSAYYKGDYNPVTVGGKRLCLPTTDILRAGDWTERTAFHPLCEKITNTESPVLKFLKDAIGLRVDTVSIALLKSLMHTACSPELHKKIGGPKAAAYLKHCAGVTKNTYPIFVKILDACKKPEYRLVNFYLKHGAVGDSGASRTCIITFPIIDDLTDPESPTVFGVKCNAVEKKNILSLIEYVFGEAEYRSMFTYGSSNPEAPYFHALMNSFYKLAHRLNQLMETHKKYIENYEEYLTPHGWAEDLENFAMYRGMVPTLSGNEGTVIVDTTARAYNRPAVEELKPWEEAPKTSGRPAVGNSQREERSGRPAAGNDALAGFRNQFQRPAEESSSDKWGRPRETTRDSRWDNNGRDDRGRGGRDSRDDRSRSRGRDDRNDRGGRGGRDGGRGHF